MDGDAGEAVGRKGRLRLLSQARRHAPRCAQGACAARRADRGRRDPGRPHRLQLERRIVQAKRRADRLAAGAAGRGAAAGHRHPQECAAPAGGAGLRRLRALARGPGALQLDGPRAGQHESEDASQPVRIHAGRRRDRARRAGEVDTRMGQALQPEVSLVALVFVLGLKHGLDPDHLVAIDGFTRTTKREEMRRWCGLFFSLGHGLVVTLVGVAVALAAARWQAPGWLELSGAWISIAVLTTLGVANLLALVRTPAGQPVALVGARSHWLPARLAQASHPAVIAAVGAAFAVSF